MLIADYPHQPQPRVGSGGVDEYRALYSGTNIASENFKAQALWVIPSQALSLHIDDMADKMIELVRPPFAALWCMVLFFFGFVLVSFWF